MCNLRCIKWRLDVGLVRLPIVSASSPPAGASKSSPYCPILQCTPAQCSDTFKEWSRGRGLLGCGPFLYLWFKTYAAEMRGKSLMMQHHADIPEQRMHDAVMQYWELVLGLSAGTPVKVTLSAVMVIYQPQPSALWFNRGMGSKF